MSKPARCGSLPLPARKEFRCVRTCRPLRSQPCRASRRADGGGYSDPPACPGRWSIRSGPIPQAPWSRRTRGLCSRPTRSSWFVRRPSNSCNSSATTSTIGRGRSRLPAFSLIERVSPMMLFRLSKIAMIAALAAFAFVVAYDNLVDYDSNYEFVRHVLSMDTTFPNNALMGRAITDTRIWTIAYAAIIAVEALTCLFLSVGALALLTRLKAPAERFNRAKIWAVAGLTVGFGLWFFGFLVIAGEYFAMWQSQTWNGQEAAFRIVMVMLGVLIFVSLPDRDVSSPPPCGEG